jgi:hypothetical protein
MQLRHWRIISLTLAAGVLVAGFGTRTPAGDTSATRSVSASEAQMKKDITFLASDEMEGRGPTTKGLVIAGDYIANEFQKAGLKPGGINGTYFQPFRVQGSRQVGPARFVLRGPNRTLIQLKEGAQFNALGLSDSDMVSGPLVFAGYGITAEIKVKRPVVVSAMDSKVIKVEEKEETFDYDDYANLDVEGKIVLAFREAPRASNNYVAERALRARHAGVQGLKQKIANAEKHKAAAIVFINDRSMLPDGDDLMDFNFHAMEASVAKIPVFTVRRSVVQSLLKSTADLDLEAIEEDIDRELKPHSVALAGWTGNLEVQVTRSREMLPLRNVIGYLEGHGPQANEIVVVGAHYDHLGYGGFGSLAGVKKPTIHHGADDNGSGTTAVMELARRFAAMPNREGRKIVFMTFSGEELGLLGSRYFCEHPLIPLKDVAAMVNLDMVGRLRLDEETKKDKLFVEGIGSSKMWGPFIDALNSRYDFKLSKTAAVIPYSDHYWFYAKKVPVCFFWTNYHPDYHRPTDTSDKINVPGMRRIVDLTEEALQQLATMADRPQYQEVKQTASSQPRTQGPRLGIMPAYGDEGDGLLVDGVSNGGPAAKAGIKKGDRIVEIAGKPVKNIEGYMSAMRDHKRGEPLDIGIMRDKKKITLKVTPE